MKKQEFSLDLDAFTHIEGTSSIPAIPVATLNQCGNQQEG